MSYRIPDYIMEGMRHYVDDRCPTGSFLHACFSNDLTLAICLADEASLASMVDIVKYIYNERPSDCHGSAEKVRRWLRREEMLGEEV